MNLLAIGMSNKLLFLQDGDKDVDLGLRANCSKPKIIHRTSSLDDSID